GGMRSVQSGIRNTRGATLVLVAVCLVGMMSAMALAIDLGMLFRARADAQRAADAIALAGASAFLDGTGSGQNPVALRRTDSLAAVNQISNVLLDTANAVTTAIPADGSRRVENEVTVEVLPQQEKVRAWVRRAQNDTWFARLFGRDFMPVQAYAAARATPAGSAKCIKPIAMPDVWDDPVSDLNKNRLWDPNEKWLYGDDPGDTYKKYTGEGGAPDETGYGGKWRDPPFGGNKTIKDYGRPLQLKSPDPQDPYNPMPSVFNPWRIPFDEDQEPCDKGGSGGEDKGAAVYRRNICSCNSSSVQLGVPYDIETGNMVGPTFQGFKELIDEDPAAQWADTADGGKGAVINSDPKYGAWMNSPRVVKIALYEPGQIDKPGMQTLIFNNFGLFFVGKQKNKQSPIDGRFIMYVSGNDQGPVEGPLVRILQLVE
ncbi:MAG: pilus assembly protein TadG-related protein, partial [Gemmatimonadales bacterium]